MISEITIRRALKWRYCRCINQNTLSPNAFVTIRIAIYSFRRAISMNLPDDGPLIPRDRFMDVVRRDIIITMEYCRGRNGAYSCASQRVATYRDVFGKSALLYIAPA